MSRCATSLVLVTLIAMAAPAFATSLFFDFGDPGQMAPGNYNNFVHNGDYPNPPATIFNAIDENGLATGISVEVTDIFWPGTNYNGATSPSGDAAQFAVQATQDNFFGSTGSFGGYTEPTGGFTLSGLSTAPGTAYTFTFFGSRMNVSDNRETYYDVSGASSGVAYLDVSNNVSEVAVVADILADSAGQITVEVGPGPNNNNGSGFYYIGAMRIDVVPEPSSVLLLGLGACGLGIRRRA